MQDLIGYTQGVKYYSKIDLLKAFHQIKLRKKNKEKTAF